MALAIVVMQSFIRKVSDNIPSSTIVVAIAKDQIISIARKIHSVAAEAGIYQFAEVGEEVLSTVEFHAGETRTARRRNRVLFLGTGSDDGQRRTLFSINNVEWGVETFEHAFGNSTHRSISVVLQGGWSVQEDAFVFSGCWTTMPRRDWTGPEAMSIYLLTSLRLVISQQVHPFSIDYHRHRA